MTIAPYREDTSSVGLPGTLSPVGLALPEGLTFHEWEHVGTTLKTIRDSALRWWWGDWLNYGERKWGEKYAQGVDETDYTYGSLANVAWVCKQVDISLRSEKLSFSHHKEVAPLPPDEQQMWLDDAAENGWSVRTLREMIAQTKQPTPPLRDHEAEEYARSRTIDEATGEVFNGGDWPESVEADEVLSPPIPLDLREAIVGGEVGEHAGVARWHAVTTHLYRAAREAQPLLTGWEPDDLAAALSIEEAAGLLAIAPLVEFVSAVVATRRDRQHFRRVK